jgi:hypothetical protein
VDDEDVEGLETVALRDFEESTGLFGGEGRDFFLRCPRRIDRFGRVAYHQPPPERLLERPMQDDVDILDGAR